MNKPVTSLKGECRLPVGYSQDMSEPVTSLKGECWLPVGHR